MPGLPGAAERRRLATDRRRCSRPLRLFGITGCSAMLYLDVRTRWAPSTCRVGGGASAERHVLAALCLPVLALVRIGTVWDAGSAVAGSG
jgi:hypothetical protein